MKFLSAVLLLALMFVVSIFIVQWAWNDIAVGAFGWPKLSFGQIVLGLAALKVVLGHIKFKAKS